jgi:hypothetical protein
MFEHMSIAQSTCERKFRNFDHERVAEKRKKKRGKEGIESLKKHILKCPNDDVSYIRRDLPTVSPNSIGELLKTYSSNTLT